MKISYRTEQNAKAISALWGKPLDGRPPYNINAVSADDVELFLFDILGWPFNDINAMVRDISAIKSSNILVRINSPGGDIIDSFHLFQALKNHQSKVTTRIESLAASSASILALTGSEVQAYPSSFMMIHNSAVLTCGNAQDLTEIADILSKFDSNMLDVYTGKTKMGKKAMKAMMDAETWMNAEEMKAKGFIDTILTNGKAAKAEFDLSIFANAPAEDRELTERDAEKALRDAGFSRHKAKALLAGRSQDAESEAEIIAELQKSLTILGGK